ncbi:MAG: DUF917 domain-containing protein [Bacillota bacterium]
MATYLHTDQDLEDFVRGCTILGVGGGGNPVEGLKALKEQVAAGRKVGWVELCELPDQGWAACTFLMGSTAPLTEEKKQQMRELGLISWKWERNLPLAVKELEGYTGKTVDVLVPFELGGSNTPAPIAAAAALGKLVVDGDYAGRAVPEITQTTAVATGFPFCPVASVDKWGNVCFLREAISYQMAERIGKLISDAAFGSTGLAGFMVPLEQMKKVVLPGTLSKALEVGRTVRLARESGGDVFQALHQKHGFRLLFKGTVVDKRWEDREGYYWGTHTLHGEGEFTGHTFKVFFKNENHLSWFDGRPFVTSPDLIMNLDPVSGEPVINDKVKVGTWLVIMGAPCEPGMRSEALLKVLGPRYFGMDADYTPIEELC